MLAALEAFVAAQRARAFEWGVSDCCLFAADWVQACAGHDPADGIRGTYADRHGAFVTVRRLGGLSKIGARSGWARTDAPNLGAIGILGDGPRVLGVCLGDGWIFRGAESGVTYLRRPIVGQAWAAPCPR